MKKKLLALLILGYVGGSFTEEPSSPFGGNPFGASASFDAEHRERANPFVAPQSESPFGPPHQSEGPNEPGREPFIENSSPFHEPEDNQPSPFAERSPFGAPEEDQRERIMRAAPFDRPSVIPQEQREPRPEPHMQPPPAEMSGDAPDEANTSPADEQQGWEPATGEPQKSEKESPEDQVVDGELDTLERQGSGNWLLKRVWWEKTEPVYEQIKQVFNDIMNARMDFISQRNRLDRELDVAYGQIGMEEGELQDILEHCLNLAKQEKKEQGFLTKEEETLYNALQHKQNDLAQIKLDVKALQDVDQKIDEALEALFKQIDVANQYEQKAWENFKEIARELNDKVARKSYYETEGLLKDIQGVHMYITGEFAAYFNQTLQSARSHSQNITSQVHALKQSGVDLKQQLDALERTQEAERVKTDMIEHDKEFEAAEKKKQDQKIKKVHEEDMMSNLVLRVKDAWLHFVDRVLHAVSNVFSRVKGWFTKEETALQNREKALTLKISAEEKKINKDLAHEQQELNKEEQVVEKEEKRVAQEASHREETKEEHTPEKQQYEVREAVKGEKVQQRETRPLQEQNPFKTTQTAPVRPSVMPERENPFAPHEPEARPVSVLPSEPHNPVTVFGPPPAEHREPENPFAQKAAVPVLPPPPLPAPTEHPVSPFVG